MANRTETAKRNAARRYRGAVKIVRNSPLRKLARAMRRGMVPPERQFVIDAAEKRAAARRAVQ